MEKIILDRKNLFDYIRIYASMQVFLRHGYKFLNLEIPALVSNFFSFSGVDIFFAVSGFLITISWLNSNFNFKTYALNRFLRIMPALWLSAIISFLILVFFGKFQFIFSFKGLIWLISQGSFLSFWNPIDLRDIGVGVMNGSLWTLTVEFQFYLLLPFLIFSIHFFKKKGTPFSIIFLIILAFLSILIRLLVPNIPPEELGKAREGSILVKLLYVSIVPYLNQFLVGIFLAFFVQKLGQIKSSKLFIFCGLLLILFDKLPMVHSNLGIWLYPLCVGFLFIGIGLLKSPFVIKFDLSYGIYLYHMLVVNFLLELNNLSQNLKISFYFLLTFLIASFSWHFIEKPSLDLKKILQESHNASKI